MLTVYFINNKELRNATTLKSINTINNTDPYIVTNYNVYALLNSSLQPTTNVAPTNGTGTFTITVISTITIYFILVGCGGGGGSGNEGGGGGR